MEVSFGHEAGLLVYVLIWEFEAGTDALLVLGGDRADVLEGFELWFELGALLVQAVNAPTLLESIGNIVGASRKQPAILIPISDVLLSLIIRLSRPSNHPGVVSCVVALQVAGSQASSFDTLILGFLDRCFALGRFVSNGFDARSVAIYELLIGDH